MNECYDGNKGRCVFLAGFTGYHCEKMEVRGFALRKLVGCWLQDICRRGYGIPNANRIDVVPLQELGIAGFADG